MKKADKKITIKDIAQLAGVSIGTVDRVLHDRGEVSSKTKDRVMKITKTLNYQPDVLASTLASKKNLKFAVVMPAADRESTFWKAPHIGIEKALNELAHFGLSVSRYLFTISDKKTLKKEGLRALKEEPDLLLIAPTFEKEAAEILSACEEKGIPYLFFNSSLSVFNQVCYVGQDALQSGMVAAKLMDYGLKEGDDILIISILRLLKNNNHIFNRRHGFIKYFENRNTKNFKLNTLDLKSLDVGDLYSELRKKLAKNPNIKGIFVTNSRVFNVARFIESEKLSGINLIGFDLTEENISYLDKEIISFLINQKPIEQTYRAIHSAFNKLVMRKHVPNEVLLPIDIVTKENLKYYE